MRRVMMLAAFVAVLTMALGGVALAKVVTGTNGPDRLEGTSKKDDIYGLRGFDYLDGRGGPDELYGGKGNDEMHGKYWGDYLVGGNGYDVIFGSYGKDRVEAADGKHDYVDCGPGEEDRASVDYDEDDVKDRVKNCEYINGEAVEAPGPPPEEPPAEE